MKKLLAMLLAALMLISACAVAEVNFGGKLVVKDVVISVGGETALDLTGVDMSLAVACDGTQGGLRVALDAADVNVLSGVLAFDAEKLTLSAVGLSDVYAIRYEDLLNMLVESAGGAEIVDAFMSGFEAGFEAGLSVGMDAAQGEIPAEISALMEHAVEIFSNALTDGGTTAFDGEEYAVINVAVSEEQMDVLLNDVAAIADIYAQGQLAGSGYDSYAQMFADAQLRLSVNGEVYVGEAEVNAMIYVNAITADMTEPEKLAIFADFIKDAEEGGANFEVTLTGVAGEENIDLGGIYGAYSETDGAVNGIEMSIYGPSGENNGIYVGVYAPAEPENGLWQVSIGSLDGTASFHTAFGTADGLNQFSAQVISGDQSVYLDYLGADGAGNLSFGMASDGESVADVSAIVEVAADDGAWLPGAVDAVVDLLTIDEAQTETLSNEGMMLLLNAVAGLSQANESLAEMIGGMMG